MASDEKPKRIKRKSRFQKTIGVRPGENEIAGLDYPGPGARNGYRCDDCGIITLVVHLDAGVTPMFLSCKQQECDGRSVSLGYPGGVIPGKLLPAKWAWYRPQPNDPILNDPALRSHILQGGLALRQI